MSLFPDQSKVDGVANRMNTVFADLFLRGEAEKLPPVSAPALYYDYRELTPVGVEGDEMVRRLADRLVTVDLLQQAAELLDYQVQFRLRGEEKAIVAACLAAIHLFARDSAKALETLQVSRWPTLREDVRRERTHLEARALMELRRYDEARAILAVDTTRDGMLLRGDIEWRAQNWGGVARALEAYLGDAWRAVPVLLLDDRRQVLRIGSRSCWPTTRLRSPACASAMAAR